jgi:hypothetical protein
MSYFEIERDIFNARMHVLKSCIGNIHIEIKNLNEIVLYTYIFPYSMWKEIEGDIHNIKYGDVYDIGILSQDNKCNYIYRQYFILKRDIGKDYFYNGINMRNSFASFGKWNILDLVKNRIHYELLNQSTDDQQCKLKIDIFENIACLAHTAGGEVYDEYVDYLKIRGITLKMDDDPSINFIDATYL